MRLSRFQEQSRDERSCTSAILTIGCQQNLWIYFINLHQDGKRTEVFKWVYIIWWSMSVDLECQCGLKHFELLFFFPSPLHSSRTSPSLTLQTKALSSSPPVTAMLFVAGSKLTQKTEPGHKIKQEKNNLDFKFVEIWISDIVIQDSQLLPLCLEKVRSLSSCSSSGSISSSVSHPSSSPAFPGSSKSTSPKSSAKSSDQETQWK